MNSVKDKRQDYQLPVDFDQYQRYKIVSFVVEYYREVSKEKYFHVLEIGANKPKHLRAFLPDDTILFTDVVLDKDMQSDPEFLMVDGTKMPFNDGSFDFVVAADVLEHIPYEKRKDLLREAVRVAKYATVITFPYDSQDTIMAENRVSAYYKAVKGEDFIWLKEHREQRLPNLKDIDACLQKEDCDFFRVLHGDIILWEKMYYSIFDALGDVVEWEFRRQIDQFYINDLFLGDISDSCYRAVYVLTHEKAQPLQKYLEGLRRSTSPEKMQLLESLFQAQHEIHLQRRETWFKQDLQDKSAYIQLLERKTADMEANWRTDVEHWKADVQNLTEDHAQKMDEISRLMQCVENANSEISEHQKRVQKMLEQLEESETQRIELTQRLEESEMQRIELTQQLEESCKQYQAISEAFFWKITKPMRAILDILKREIKVNDPQDGNI